MAIFMRVGVETHSLLVKGDRLREGEERQRGGGGGR